MRAFIMVARRARKRLGTDIDAAYLHEMWKAQGGKCALTGIVMTWGGGPSDPYTLSVDRITPELGYTRGNIRLILLSVNAFKGVLDDDTMYRTAEALLRNRKG